MKHYDYYWIPQVIVLNIKCNEMTEEKNNDTRQPGNWETFESASNPYSGGTVLSEISMAIPMDPPPSYTLSENRQTQIG